MANYTGANCPVCGKRFAEDDDIVVCPVCGAPHHRACYKQLGRCALDEMHIKGHTWQPEGGPAGQQAAAGADCAPCPACGAQNPAMGLFCQICGAPLRGPSAPARPQQPFAPARAAQDAYAAAFGGLSPDEEIEGVRARDIALFVGENSHYFLPRFKKLAEGAPLSFNWSALLFNFLYFFYRKMYLFGGLLLGLIMLTQLPTYFFMPEYAAHILANMTMEDFIAGISPPTFTPQAHLWLWNLIPYLRFFVFGVVAVFAALANRLYMGCVLRSVRCIRARYLDENGRMLDDQTYVRELGYRGRTSKAAVCIVIGALFAAQFVICFIITFAAVMAPL